MQWNKRFFHIYYSLETETSFKNYLGMCLFSYLAPILSLIKTSNGANFTCYPATFSQKMVTQVLWLSSYYNEELFYKKFNWCEQETLEYREFYYCCWLYFNWIFIVSDSLRVVNIKLNFVFFQWFNKLSVFNITITVMINSLNRINFHLAVHKNTLHYSRCSTIIRFEIHFHKIFSMFHLFLKKSIQIGYLLILIWLKPVKLSTKVSSFLNILFCNAEEFRGRLSSPFFLSDIVKPYISFFTSYSYSANSSL